MGCLALNIPLCLKSLLIVFVPAAAALCDQPLVQRRAAIRGWSCLWGEPVVVQTDRNEVFVIQQGWHRGWVDACSRPLAAVCQGRLCSLRMLPLHLCVHGDCHAVLLLKSSLKLHLPFPAPCLPPLASCPGFCEQTRIDHSN